MTDAPVVAAPEAIETTTETTPVPVSGQWQSKIEACRRLRKTLSATWKTNVQFRKNKVFEATNEAQSPDRIAVPVDWSRTKNKISQLFFQVPEVKVKARQTGLEAAAAIYGAALNFELDHEMKTYHLMDEVLGDTINAAGLGAAIVGFDGQFETVQVPAIDLSTMPPEQVAALQAQPDGVPMTSMQRSVYQCYYAKRISPASLLWPADYVGSDWQQAEWLGYEDRITFAEALRNKWVTAEDEATMGDKLLTVSDDENDPEKKSVGKYVQYSVIFYRPFFVDPSVKDPRKLKRVIWVEGKDKPAEDKDFQWQKYDTETRKWIGLTSFPIKVLTLTWVSDEAVPPSDSEMARPQVRELNESRSQMIQQRKHSTPLRWYDVNMVDEIIQDQLAKGEYQGMIPMNGPGENAVGEVARASYPRETFEFQRIIEADLDQSWSSGPNQQGFSTPGDTSASEAQIIASSASVRLDYERARVLRFFLEIAEATGALMQMFQDDEKWVELEGKDGLQQLQAWDKNQIRGDFAFTCKPDAAVKVDVGQKRAEALNVYKLTRRDPLANGAEVLKNVFEWHGFDLTKVMSQPAPPPPKPPALRYTFKGEDLTNPMVVALVQANSEKPLTPQDIQAAAALMGAAGVPNMVPQVMPVPQPGTNGQPPTVEQVMKGTAPHPGPPEQVDPLGQRYGHGENPNQGEGV